MKQTDLDLVRQIWHPLSFVSDENCKQTLKLWLSEGNYYIENSPPQLSLYCCSLEEIKRSLSLDAFRFASHAAQTVFEMERGSAYPKLTSWQMIQTYYAAFFAGHAVLRFFGRSFSHLEPGHVRFLKERCNSEAGYKPDLDSGYYLLTFSPNKRLVEFERYKESHKGMWMCFLKLLEDVSADTLSLRAIDTRKQDFSSKLDSIAEAMRGNGQFPSGNWLSHVRNEVNYKSQLGTWFPFNKATPDFVSLMRRVKEWRACNVDIEDPKLLSNDSERFFVSAFQVINLALSIANDYQLLSGKAGRRSMGFSQLIKQSAAA